MARRPRHGRGRPRAFRAAHVPTPVSSVPPSPDLIPVASADLTPSTITLNRHRDIADNHSWNHHCNIESDPDSAQIEDLSLEDQEDAATEFLEFENSFQPFRFLDLPSELRLRIYKYHFGDITSPIDLSPENYRAVYQRMLIFRTCRQIYQESSYFFYSTKAFRLFPTHPGRFLKTKRPLLARLKPAQRAAITALELRVGPSWGKPPRGWVVNSALGLAHCTSLRQLSVFVECDPSNSVFDGFRRTEGFYEAFCADLLDRVLNGLPAVEQVQFDAWSSVKKGGAMMTGLIETARKQQARIVWGPEKGWKDDVGDDEVKVATKREVVPGPATAEYVPGIMATA